MNPYNTYSILSTLKKKKIKTTIQLEVYPKISQVVEVKLPTRHLAMRTSRAKIVNVIDLENGMIAMKV